jgi:hypothetical protein
MVIYVSLGFLQYADIPVAYYFLAANVLLFMGDSATENKPAPVILAGIMVGAALWTKNEGWPLLASTIGVKLLLDLVSRQGISQTAKWLGTLLIGLAPFLITTIYFKIALAPPNDLLAGLDLASVGDKLTSLRRYWIIIRAAKNFTLNYGSLVYPLVSILLVYGLIQGLYLPKEQRPGIAALALRIVVILGSYYAIYLLTPKDLFWHISSSIDRLISQILPSLLFLYFLVVSSPTRTISNQINNRSG